MAKIVYIKDHLEFKAGQMDNVTDDRANYFVLCGVADLIEEDIKENSEAKKQDGKPKKKGE